MDAEADEQQCAYWPEEGCLGREVAPAALVQARDDVEGVDGSAQSRDRSDGRRRRGQQESTAGELSLRTA